MANKEIKPPFGGDEYVGNIFGPKMTLYGGLLILFFLGIMIYRHWALGVPPGMVDPVEEVNIEVTE